MNTRRALGVVGALALAGLSTLILASPAQAALDCIAERTSSIQVTGRPDSGEGGVTWAEDDFIRTVHFCEIGATEGGAAGRSDYIAFVVDDGTFETIGGLGQSPQDNVVLTDGLIGTMEGGFTNSFTALSDFETYEPLVGPFAHPAGPTTGNWVSSYFDDDFVGVGTAFGNGNNDDWRWVYTTCNQQWINQTNTENIEDQYDGNHGDITGVTACPPAAGPNDDDFVGGVTGNDVTGIVVVGGASLLVGVVLIAYAARRRSRIEA